MNTLVIVLIAAVCLVAGYCLYGRWLANKWGISTRMQRHLLSAKTTDRIMFRQMV